MVDTRAKQGARQKRIFVLLVILIVVVIAFAFAKRGLVDTYLKIFLTKTISYELGADVKIIELDVDIFNPTIHARGLRINNVAGSRTLLLAREVKVFLKPFPIFLRRIIIPRIELEDVAFSGVEDDLRSLDFEKIFKKKSRDKKIFSFEISQVKLSNLEVAVEDEKNNEAYFNFSDIRANMAEKRGSVYLKGECRVDLENKRYEIPDIYGKVNYLEDTLTISDLRLHKKNDLSVKLKGKIIPELDVKGLIETDLSGRLASNFLPDASGTINIPFELSGKIRSPDISGYFQGRDIAYLQYKASTIKFQFSSKKRALMLKDGLIAKGDLRLTLSGRAQRWDRELNLDIGFENVGLASLSEYLPMPNIGLQGQISGKANIQMADLKTMVLKADVKGNLASLFISYALPKAKEKIQFSSLEKLSYEASIDYRGPDNILVDKLRAYGEVTDLSLSGKLGQRKTSLGYSLILRDLGLFSLNGFRLSGAMNLSGNLRYEGTDVVSEGSLNIDRLALADIWMGNISGIYRMEDSVLNLNDLSLIDGNTSLDANAVFDMSGNERFSLNASLNRFAISKVLKTTFADNQMLSNISGEISGDIVVRGEDSSYDGRIQLSADGLKFYDHNAGSLIISADLESSRIDLKQASFVYEQREILNGTGYYIIGGDAELKFKGSSIDIDLIDFFQVKKYLGESLISFDFSYSRQAGSNDLNGKFLVTEDSEEKSLPIIDMNFKTDLHTVLVDGNYEGEKVTYEIEYPLEEGKLMQAYVSAKDWNFAPLLGRKMTLNRDVITGILTMETRISGVPGDIRTFNGIVSIADFGLWKEDVELRNAQPITVLLENGSYYLSSFELAGTQTKLSLGGSGELLGENDISIEGYAFFNIISLFFKEFIRAEGRVDLRATMQGSFDDMEIMGEGKLARGVIVIRDFPNIIQNLETDLVFSQKKIIFDNITGEMGGGVLRGSGLIEIGSQYDGGLYFDSTVELKEVSSLFPIDYPGLISGTLSFKGPYFVPTLSGDLTVKRITYSKPWDWRSRIISFGEKTYSLGIKKDPQIYLNVHIVTEGGDIEIKNNVAQAKLSGDLRITGSDRNVGALGEIKVLRGKINFLENEFELSEGSVKFIERERPLGVFDIVGQTTVKGTEIELMLRGTSDDPQIELSSQPPKSETDIVTLLTLGVESSELSVAGAQSDLSQSLMTSVLTGVIQENIERTFRKSKILDTFQVYPSFSEETGTTELRVGIGRKMPYKMQILYSTDVNNIGRNQEVKLDKEITDNLSIQGILKEKTDERVDLGLDFEFKIDF